MGAAKFGPKKDYLLCCGYCCGPCGENCYMMAPRTCCADELSYCLFCAGDCAFPCVDTIPKTFGCCGLMCMPSFGFCPVMKEFFPDASAWDDSAAKVEDQVQASVAVAQ